MHTFQLVHALLLVAVLTLAPVTAWAQPAPAPPAALSVAVAGSAVTLRWLPPLYLPAGYFVEAGTAPGRSDLGTTAVGGAPTALTVTGVPAGNYFVRVRATGPAGVSAPSNEAIVTVGAACQLPAAPTAFTAAVVASVLSVQWSGGGGSYQLEAGSAPGGTDVFNGNVGSTTSLSAAVPAGAWFLRVRERNACGFGPPTADVLASNAVSGPPLNLRSSTIGTTVTFRWDAPSGPAPATYALEVGSAPGLSNLAVAPVAGSALSLTAPGVPAGTYYVRLRGTTAAGLGAPSNELALTVGATPSHLAVVTFDSLAPNGPAFTTHSERGYTVDAISGPWTSGPALLSRNPDRLTALDSELRVTAAGTSPFTLVSVRLYSSITPIPYVLRGVLNGATVYTIAGTVPNTFGSYATVVNPQAATLVDTVYLTVTNPAIPTCPTCNGNPVGVDDLVLRP